MTVMEEKMTEFRESLGENKQIRFGKKHKGLSVMELLNFSYSRVEKKIPQNSRFSSFQKVQKALLPAIK